MSKRYFYTKRNIVKINPTNVQDQSNTSSTNSKLANKTKQLIEAQHIQMQNIIMNKAPTNRLNKPNNTNVNMAMRKCPTCGLHFRNSVYSFHVKMKHNYKCNICNKMFANIKTMQDHKERMHIDVNTNQPNNVLTFPTPKFENESSQLKVPQIQCNNINFAKDGQINNDQMFPLNSFGMKNIKADQLNIAQTYKNNNLINELSQYIEVHKLQTDMEINKDVMSQLNKTQNIKINTQPTTQYTCSYCDLKFKSRHEHNSHMKNIHNHYEKNVQKLNTENCYTQIPVDEFNNQNESTMLEPYFGLQTNSIKTDLTSQTHKLKIINDMPSHLKETQTLCNPINFVERSQINEKRFLPLKIIRMQNTGANQLNEVQTQRNNYHTDVITFQTTHLQNYMEDTQNMCSQLKYYHKSYNRINHMQSEPILKNENSNIEMPVNEADHLNFINTTSLQKDITNSNYINPFSQPKGLKMNSTSPKNDTSINLGGEPDLKLITRPTNQSIKLNLSKCVKCDNYVVNNKISDMQAMQKKSNKPVCSNCKSQNKNYDKLEANIALKEVVIDKSEDMQIDEHVNLEYFKPIQPVISQTIGTEMTGVFQEHSQVNEPYNYQLQDKAANPCNEKERVKKQSIFTCNICDCPVTTMYKFKQHIRIKHKNKCSSCHKKFIRKITLVKHMREMHSALLGKQLKYFKTDNLTIPKTIYLFKCSDCKKQFIYPNKLIKHIQNKHIQQDNNSCREKYATLNQLDNMSKFQSVHVKMEESTIDKATIDLVNCIETKDLLPTEPNKIQNHLLHNYQTQEKVDGSCVDKTDVIKRAKFMCRFCNKQFGNSKALNQHLGIDCNFKCFDCGKQFICPNKLIKHIQIKHIQQNINSCGEKYAISNQLDDTSKFQTGYVKIEKSSVKTAIDLINCIETKDLLPIIPNDTQYIIDKLEPGDILNNQLGSYELPDTVACASDDTEQVDKHTQYICNICDDHFTIYDDYKRHIGSEQKQKCDVCEEPFNCKTAMEKHIRDKHNEQDNIDSTEISNVDFAKPSVPSKDFSPNTKTGSSTRRSMRVLQTLTIHNNIPMWFNHLGKKLKTNNRFVCELCNSVLKTSYWLGHHLVKVHKFKCSLCKKCFLCEDDNLKHTEAKHKQHNKKQNLIMSNKKFSCKECNTTFDTDKLYQIHVKYAHKLWPKKNSCSLCDTVLTNSEEFITHMKTHSTNDKPFVYLSFNIMNRSSNRSNYNLTMFGF